MGLVTSEEQAPLKKGVAGGGAGAKGLQLPPTVRMTSRCYYNEQTNMRRPQITWRRYLASDCQSEWATRARRSLKFCEMQVHHSIVRELPHTSKRKHLLNRL
jgi:hypothetical protein